MYILLINGVFPAEADGPADRIYTTANVYLCQVSWAGNHLWPELAGANYLVYFSIFNALQWRKNAFSNL